MCHIDGISFVALACTFLISQCLSFVRVTKTEQHLLNEVLPVHYIRSKWSLLSSIKLAFNVTQCIFCLSLSSVHCLDGFRLLVTITHKSFSSLHIFISFPSNSERERERERERETDRQTDRQTERDRQRETDRDRETDRQRDRDRQTERQRQTDTETDRERQIHG